MKTKVLCWMIGVIVLPLIVFGQFVNVSTRLVIPAGQPLMVGFVVNAPGRFLIRGVGPGLAQFGVQNTMKNPLLRIYRGNTYLGGNDDWIEGSGVDVQTCLALQAKVGAFPLANPSSDAACVINLPAGAYTAHVTDLDGGGGDVLVEVYEIPNG